MKVKLTRLATAILLLPVIANARPVCSGDVLGRDMDVPVVGRIGHLAMATGDDIYFPTNMTIEVEPNGENSIVWGTVSAFIKKTRYWGSRGGLIMVKESMYRALNEGKRQSFWCPHYSVIPTYDPGTGWFDMAGNPHPTKCGTFRCDTFVGYIMSAGGNWAIRNNNIQLPYNAFMTFPYSNGDAFAAEKPTPQAQGTNEIMKDFNDLSDKELNAMTLEDISPYWMFKNKPWEWIAREWEVLANDDIKPLIRWGIINSFESSNQPNIVRRFIEIFEKSHDEFIRTKLVSGVMMYYQRNWERVSKSEDYAIIQKWYEKLLHTASNKERSADIVRGFIDLHDEDAITRHLSLIERHLAIVDKRLVIGLQFELIRKSPSLQKEFLPKAIKSLNHSSDTELDSMAFHYLNHLDIQDKSMRALVREFVIEKQEFYKKAQILDGDSIDSFHIKSAKADMAELLRKI